MTKFPSGKIVITPNAMNTLSPRDVQAALARHFSGDWGDVDQRDQKDNALSLLKGYRLFSAYHAADGAKFWIITEADRSATTVLLPDDY
jgi:hypothetical protein